ncbi:iron-containing alcohol dehydrogenase [Candidatus Bathyarchaeota archaeon]|nr:iron-containing alcohol dehydrogenase [Candidatus Bathyarchaeota archaeon]
MSNPDTSKVHIIKLPWRIAIGEKAICSVTNLLENLGTNCSFIVAGPSTYKLFGKQLSSILERSRHNFEFFLSEKADFDSVKKVEKEANTVRAQILIGFGGGKNIDLAKTAAFNLRLPYISVPTIPSHDGIASASSSISKKGDGYSEFLDPPAAVVADMDYLVKAPFRHYAAGCGDVISKFTSVTDWKLASEERNEYYGEYAAQMASLAAEIIVKNSNGYKEDPRSAVRLLTEALISCGYAMCVAGSSRPCSGSEHSFSHAIDRLLPENIAMHGEKCALGTLIMSYYQGKDYDSVRNALMDLKLPTSYKQIGISPKILIKAVTLSSRVRDRYTILDKLKIGEGREREVEADLRFLHIID